ncbi:hypothetical protein D9613_006247 [Agrocybe pediades]|uniref:Uncharacterized protein n=1 Tax=Agrocybe pediades TaxID=84607 RepID=A0A8H4QV75_9AGAR|nr:hypothetical protein D9613_006247 [Agrocybe pediades]
MLLLAPSSFSLFLLAFSSCATAHLAAWHKGMYCMKGNQGNDDRNTNDAVQPLYQLQKADWWFHHNNKCDEFPPDDGNVLEIPANGEFTVEHAVNRVFTTLVDNPVLGTYVNGQEYSNLGESREGKEPGSECIVEPNIHTQNETMAAGTAFAISYQSELSAVTQDNLVVFSVLYQTPWKRIATYQAPDLPACPEGGCICAWGWIPNGCGEPSSYMVGFKCTVMNATSKRSIASPSPPAWCEDDQSKCVKGAKQMIYWNQAEGNNVEVDGTDSVGQPKSPGYSAKMGFSNGAQNDIFAD